MQIAFIDDKPENLTAWLAGTKSICRNQATLAVFLSVDELEEGYVPDILFTDYFLEDRNGFEVIEMARDRFGERVYLIVHSAEPWANELLLNAGANEALSKFEDQNPSTTLDVRFRTFDDLLELAQRGNKSQKSGVISHFPPRSRGISDF